MRLTIPKVRTPEKVPEKDLFFNIIEILWHTIMPVFCTYLFFTFENLIWMLPVLVIIIVRLDKDEFKIKK